MTAPTKLRFETIGRQEYMVFEGKTLLGVVCKFERRYNIARPFTMHGWQATTEPGKRLYGEGSPVGNAYYTSDTRAEAAEALRRVHYESLGR